MDSEKLDAATAAALGEAEEDEEQTETVNQQGHPEDAAPEAISSSETADIDDTVDGVESAVVAGAPEADSEDIHQPASAEEAAPISAGPIVGVVRLFGMPVEVADSEIKAFLGMASLPDTRIMQICGLR